MSIKKISMDKYGISENAYNELRAFCLQYSEKKEKLKDALCLKSPSFSGMPHGSGVSDPTAKAAAIYDKYKSDIDLIENTAKEVAPEIAKYIILNVTSENCPPWMLKTQYGMEAGEKYFCKKRRLFYYNLAVKKQIV